MAYQAGLLGMAYQAGLLGMAYQAGLLLTTRATFTNMD